MKTLGNVPKECQGLGNGNSVSFPTTKELNNALYKYDFVLNNYTQIEVCQIKATLSKICKKAVFGFEIGEGGTPHLQGYISLIKKERYTGLHKLSGLERCSFRKCRNEEALINYCKKDNKDIWIYPKPYTVEIKHLYRWQLHILDIINQSPDSRSIHWFWEPNGGIGKTTFQKYIYTHYPDTIVCGGKSADMKHCVVDYFNNNKKLPKIILMNLPKTQELNYFSYTGVEEVKDMFFYSGKYEGGMICGENPHILIFANEPPNRDNMALDRWKILDITTWSDGTFVPSSSQVVSKNGIAPFFSPPSNNIE